MGVGNKERDKKKDKTSRGMAQEEENLVIGIEEEKVIAEVEEEVECSEVTVEIAEEEEEVGLVEVIIRGGMDHLEKEVVSGNMETLIVNIGKEKM